MSEKYIKNHFNNIKKYASVIENRGDDSDCNKDTLINDNKYNLEMCKKYGCQYILINDNYKTDIDIDLG
ncbi:MAG: hypothetical protein ACI4IL_00595 [Eubacterium sp.]